MLLTGSLAAISNLSYFFDVFCRSFVVRNSFEMEQCIINRLLITPAFLFTIYGFFLNLNFRKFYRLSRH